MFVLFYFKPCVHHRTNKSIITKILLASRLACLKSTFPYAFYHLFVLQEIKYEHWHGRWILEWTSAGKNGGCRTPSLVIPLFCNILHNNRVATLIVFKFFTKKNRFGENRWLCKLSEICASSKWRNLSQALTIFIWERWKY